jgi:hypothetical protein
MQINLQEANPVYMDIDKFVTLGKGATYPHLLIVHLKFF